MWFRHLTLLVLTLVVVWALAGGSPQIANATSAARQSAARAVRVRCAHGSRPPLTPFRLRLEMVIPGNSREASSSPSIGENGAASPEPAPERRFNHGTVTAQVTVVGSTTLPRSSDASVTLHLKSAAVAADAPWHVWKVMDASDDLRSEEHTSELQSLTNLVCRLLLEKNNGTRRPPAVWTGGCHHADASARDRAPAENACLVRQCRAGYLDLHPTCGQQRCVHRRQRPPCRASRHRQAGAVEGVLRRRCRAAVGPGAAQDTGLRRRLQVRIRHQAGGSLSEEIGIRAGQTGEDPLQHDQRRLS